MSFALPNNVPSFDNAQRSYENTIWQHTGSSQRNGHTNGGIGNSLGGIFESKEVLPMYKDKPYMQTVSRRNKALFQRKRTWLGAILGFLGTLYFLGVFSSPGSSKSSVNQNGRSEVSWWSWSQPVTINSDELWATRREKVKEAFTLSWDGYAQYAWGMLTNRLHQRPEFGQLA